MASRRVLETESLFKTYGEGPTVVHALVDATLSVSVGEIVAVLGPSGSGKSTLLTAIGLINEPSSGVLRIDGETVYENGWRRSDLSRLRREKIGFIFQAHNLIPFLTAGENVLIALDINGVGKRDARRRAAELMESLGLGHRFNHYPSSLSGGEQQRTAIARALANQPKLILADEPTASLDTKRGFEVMELLRKLAHERNSAVIVVTHDHRMIEGFDRILTVNDGRVTEEDRQPTLHHSI